MVANKHVRGITSGENKPFISLRKQSQESKQQRNNEGTLWYGFLNIPNVSSFIVPLISYLWKKVVDFDLPKREKFEDRPHNRMLVMYQRENLFGTPVTLLVGCFLVSCFPVLFDLMMALQVTEAHNIALENLALFRPKLLDSYSTIRFVTYYCYCANVMEFSIRLKN